MSKPALKRIQLTQTAPALLALWLQDTPVVVWGSGVVTAGQRAARPHGEAAILDAAPCPGGQAVLTLGADCVVRRVTASLASTPLFAIGAGFADRIVSDAASGLVAIATSRTVEVRVAATGDVLAVITPPRAPTALVLSTGTARRQRQLAVAHGGGVSLYDLDSAAAAPVLLEAPGGHSGVALSPDGAFVLASSAEPALIGWRLADGQGFRMGGYPARPDGLVWMPDGALATTGGPAVLIWPFVAPDGPMGQSARMLRPRMGMLTAVAPRRNRIAAGWSDGGVDVVDTATGRSAHVAGTPPPQELDFDPRRTPNRVTTLAFSHDGRALAWGREDGRGGVVLL